MARPSVLPLPDSAVRHILAHVDDLRLTFPPARGNRPFLAAFLRLVYDATGNIYGANVTRRLLKLYAPEYRPSTVTLHDEITAFREQRSTVAESRPTNSDTTVPWRLESTEAGMLAGLQRMLSYPTPALERSYDDTLARALQAENDRLRAQNTELEKGLNEARQDHLRLTALAASLKAQAESKTETIAQMADKIQQLAEAVEVAQEQVAASHRFALGRVEDAGTEARQLREQLRLANAKIDSLRKQLTDEQTMSGALRQALSAQRSQQ